jgi:16S rRNA (guanine527-N7)-methyltransferase
MDDTQKSFVSLLQMRGIALSIEQLSQFDQYFQLLVEWNSKINLTAITERDAVYRKHFYDSLSLSFFCSLQNINSIADIGAGAGFPSIPIKIMFPHLQVTIIDSLKKRISFLELLIAELGLVNVTAIHDRAEDAARHLDLRDQFDLVTARAVASLPVLNELCLPFVKVGGLFMAMKGSSGFEELESSHSSIKELRAEIVKCHELILPGDDSKRSIIEIRKVASTPAKYPRKAGIPLKTPL